MKRALIFIFVLIFTFILRAHNYDRIPTANHLDEMLYAWSGMHLIETGVPVSWSTLDYPVRAEVFRGKIDYKGGIPKANVTLYKPWLDQPPLFSLIVGYFAHLYGANRNEFIPASFIRMPIIFFSTIISVLIFLIAKKISGYWMGILAMLIYGTTPIMVFASRTAMPESFIALCFIVIVLLLMKFVNKPAFSYIISISIFVGISGLAKPPGFLLLPFVLFVVWSRFAKTNAKLALKYSLVLIGVVIPFVVAYFLYGYYFDWEIFKHIYAIQSSRPIGFGSLGWLFITPSYDTAILRDSWYIFCLLSAVFFILRPIESRRRIVILAFIYWVIVVMLTGGESDLLAWYRFASFPFLAILGAWGIEYIYKNPSFFTTFIAFGLLLGNKMLLSNAFRSNVSPAGFRTAMLVFLGPSLLEWIYEKKVLKKITRGVIVLIVTVGIYFNVVYIYNAFEINCESKTCPLVSSTFLSRMHFPVIWRLFVLGKPDIYWCGNQICRD